MMLQSRLSSHFSTFHFRDKSETPKHLFTLSFQRFFKHLQGRPLQDRRGACLQGEFGILK